MENQAQRKSSSSSSSPSSSDINEEVLQHLDQTPPFWRNQAHTKKRLSKQLSMREVPRNRAWEKRRRQERKKKEESDSLTDEDMNELKGCIELGFGFNQKDGQRLCTTIPALDLFLAVNRQVYTSPILSPSLGASISAPSITDLGDRSSSFRSDLKICSPGDDPQHVKTKLRHWAQAVACSLRQSS